MQNFKLKTADKDYLIASLNRIVGVIQSAKKDLEENHACDETVQKIMAAKGALSRAGLEMINRGVLECLSRYSKTELEEAMKMLFKIN